MNNYTKKINGYYETPHVTDLRDFLRQCSERYGERAAYLVKNTPRDQYRPVSFIRFREDTEAFGTALLKLGLKGEKIAVIGENSCEWMVADIAAASGAGVAVPLDKELPVEEITNLLNRSSASAIVYSKKMKKSVIAAAAGAENLKYMIMMRGTPEDLPEDDGSGITHLSMSDMIEEGRDLIEQGDRSYLDAKIDPDAMSFLLFTSGTTGLAKGVMLSHRNICDNFIAVSKLVTVQEGDITLSMLPMHHCLEYTADNLTVLYQGGTVAMCDGLKYIVKNLEEAQVSVIIAVPLVLETIYKRIWKTAEKGGKADKMRKGLKLCKRFGWLPFINPRKLFAEVHESLGGRLRMAVTGAAAVDPAVLEFFNTIGILAFQGYGLTECSPIAACNPDWKTKHSSVGPAIPGAEIKLVDVDEEGVGEIVIKSPSVMLGYYENPEETAKVIRDGWLYTGDYGYIDEDGYIYISGRKKNVIITKNGKNVFPEEVEFYLCKSSFIEEAVVSGLEEGGDVVIQAEVFPDLEHVKEVHGDINDEELRAVIKSEIDAANKEMSSYKNVKRFSIRKEPFEKTTTKKIKRTYN